MFKGFKKFIARGNIMDMAVGVVMGSAFGKIVTSLVNDIIMPPVKKLLEKANFAELKIVLTEAVEADAEKGIAAVSEVAINVGVFVQTIIDFFLVAVCVYLFVRAITKTREILEADKIKAEEEAKKKAEEEAKKKAEEEANKPQPPTAEELLTEIRDLLKKQ